MFSVISAVVIASLLATATNAQTTVVVQGTASHSIPSTLWGLMYEASGYQFLQNRAFQQVTPGTTDALNAWSAVNGAGIAVIADPTPLSAALPNALEVSIPADNSGAVGFSNAGYWGIAVNSSFTYKASLHYRFTSTSTSPVNLTVALVSASGTVFASKSASVTPTTTWTPLVFSLKPSTSASSTANTFQVTLEGAAGKTALAELNPSFFRYVGGNNLEGQSIAQRWQWNATVGPLTDRPGRLGDWTYINTDGLGLLEYLQWTEDANMASIMAIWAGYSLNGASVGASGLAPYIEQARQQIEFVVGGTSTPGGALRASVGHPEPFELNWVEVGNEDFFAATTYQYRWSQFVGNLSALYPNIRFIATTDAWSPVLNPIPKSYDVHVYQTPGWFASDSFYYDSFERNGTTYFEGEYAAISTNSNDIFGSTGEAAFMTGLERNSDIVFAASYAPLLGHVNGSQWTPNLVSFDAGAVYKSTSYYVQQLFSLNRGDEYLPSTLPTPDGTLFWSVVRQNSPNSVIIKVANTVGTAASLTFQLPFRVASTGTAQVLTGGETDSNTPAIPNLVTPKTSGIKTGQNFNYTAAGFSVNVLTIQLV
ncbi:hypothetical protein EW146_g1588 [Bondarzewia mesenterica]|uniref:non-reducing end alpha-L-arabinofuranosidase n=1 Tax=Bondarzewia mesenterica TaxID=1095465 RepID=A0A4S4M386_9AGAM|nr:hypothetical protein EW146_g1588 [Bondarzewia mesenterica]